MGRILAGSNLIIEVLPESWRLQNQDTVLVEARLGDSLHYIERFGTQRRLPPEGSLSVSHMQRVVLGWSTKDQSWHLGVMLTPALAEKRGSRWVELAYWSDPTTLEFREDATQASETLALCLGLPFSLVPPQIQHFNALPPASVAPQLEAQIPSAPIATATQVGVYPPYAQPQPAYQPAPVTPTLSPPTTPFNVGRWTLKQTAHNQLAFELSKQQTWRKLLGVLWYLLCAAAFAVMGITSLDGRLMLPEPKFLPYAGLACAVVLLILAIIRLVRIPFKVTRIVVDGNQKVIQGLNGNRVRWEYPASELNAIYAVQLVGKAKAKKSERGLSHAEIDLQKRTGDFHFVMRQEHVNDKLPVDTTIPIETQNQDMVNMLTPYNAHTPLQKVSLYFASLLGIKAVNDFRIN